MQYNERMELKNKLLDPKRRSAIDARFAINHVGHKKWDIISKKMGSEFEIWSDLYESGKRNLRQDNDFNQNSHQMYCGEEIYLDIRPELISKNIILFDPFSQKDTNITKKINTKTAKKKPGAKTKPGAKAKPGAKNNQINKADKIRQDNLVRKIKSDLEDLFNTLSSEPVRGRQSIIFSAKFVELSFVKMMVQCRNLINKYDTINKQLIKKSSSKYTAMDEINELKTSLEFYYKELSELIVGFNKILKEKKLNENLSKTCLQDLDNWITNAKDIINFETTSIIIKRPELIFKTVYDSMLENKPIGPYPSQKEIFEFVTSNQKYLALVHTMLGSGKTSMVLPICGWLQANRKTIKSKLIFCCPNEVVLLEVAHMIYGMAVPFGIIIRKMENELLEYKWSTFVDKNNPKKSAIIYLCDIYTARILLEERQKCIRDRQLYYDANKRDPVNNPLTEQRIPEVPDYILMGDELTKDADSQKGFSVESGFSVPTEVFIDLMKMSPPKIILMSATLPTANQLPDLYNAIKLKHPGMIIKSFSSSEAKIGCAIISSNGELYAPHIGCQSVDDIKHILDVIKSNPFVGRFYTFEVLLQMLEIFNSLSIEVPDLSIMFDDPSKANQTNIQQFAYSMLEKLINNESNDIIEKACSMKKSVGSGVNLATIFTTDFCRFNRGCLVFSADPVSTALQVYSANFHNFLNENSERDIFQQIRLDTILDKYGKELESFKKALERIENKKDEGIIKQNKENNTKERIKSESWEQSAKLTEQKPSWDFPRALQLGSIEHAQKTNCTNAGLTGGVEPEDLPKSTSVPMDILTMLASGIGIYSLDSPLLDDEYLKTVLLLAKKGLVKTIFTDSSIAYGTNLAVSDIIMIDEVGENQASIIDKHSMKTIFQMLGRAGRGGNLSYQAKIYTTSPNNNLINKISLYAKDALNEESRDEIGNIFRAYQVLW